MVPQNRKKYLSCERSRRGTCGDLTISRSISSLSSVAKSRSATNIEGAGLVCALIRLADKLLQLQLEFLGFTDASPSHYLLKAEGSFVRDLEPATES